MTDPIISRDTIRARARAAFERGASRNDHDMNPGSAAIADWQAEWDCCHMERLQAQRQAGAQLAEVSPP